MANEGQVTFDIRFHAVTPGMEQVKLIINVEAQKSFTPGYDIVTRAVYYCARLLSSQMGVEFTPKSYDGIKKVYSIWICFDVPEYAENTITEYKIQPNSLYGDFQGKVRYDLFSAVMVCLGKKEDLSAGSSLHRLLEADLELGGTDQTFNLLMGRALQKEMGMEPQAALFMPILEGIDGVEKMSKSLGNYIGIDEDARVMFQKVMQIPDHRIIKYFELATDILPEELQKIKEQLADGINPRDSKRLLARTITRLYHSEEETKEAERFFTEAFVLRKVPQRPDTLQVVMDQGTLYDCLRPLVQARVIHSGNEFKRLLSQGGVQKNGQPVEKLEEGIRTGDVLKVGKGKFVRLELV